jgi:hypothetical protein
MPDSNQHFEGRIHCSASFLKYFLFAFRNKRSSSCSSGARLRRQSGTQLAGPALQLELALQLNK